MSKMSTNNDDCYPDDVQWEVVHYNKLPRDGQKFFSKVGDTYMDKTDVPPVAWKVVAVAKNTVHTPSRYSNPMVLPCLRHRYIFVPTT